MGSFILFVLITIILIIGFGVLFVLRFVRMVIRGPKASPFGNSYNNEQRYNDNNSKEQEQYNHEKVFSKDEGEYVDYEEIK